MTMTRFAPKLDPSKVRVVKLKGGHHFNGDYAGLAQRNPRLGAPVNVGETHVPALRPAALRRVRRLGASGS